jgi:hypothetical protein
VLGELNGDLGRVDCERFQEVSFGCLSSSKDSSTMPKMRRRVVVPPVDCGICPPRWQLAGVAASRLSFVAQESGNEHHRAFILIRFTRGNFLA